MKLYNLPIIIFLIIISPIAILAGYFCAHVDKIDGTYEKNFYRKGYIKTIKNLWRD